MADNKTTDQAFMDAALALAARGLGNVWPNPAVGCVLVRGGRVVGRGWTQPGGRPHAETEALARAGDAARGATAYVTLEPCSHHGVTPPCADALVAAGVTRCVVACTDSDPRVSGKGIAALRVAGVEVVEGVREAEARALNAGFFTRLERGRPLVTLKIATSLDGCIATRSGESQWITGPASRARAHLERARHDAVLVGGGTLAADDPDLTCRLPGVDPRPVVRVALSSGLSVSTQARMVRTVDAAPTWIFCRRDAVGAEELRTTGALILPVEGAGDGLDLEAVLETLAGRGITRLMVEGGGQVAAGFLARDLVDRVVWFRAARMIGGDGLPAIGQLGLDRLADCPDFSRRSVEAVGEDVIEIYERR